LDEADGEVDALFAPPVLLLDPDQVEHRFELRLQVRSRLSFRSLCVHDASTLPARGCRGEWAASAAATAPAPGRWAHVPLTFERARFSVRLVPMSLSATRTLVLIPVAIALNIVLGSLVQTVLKLPIYMDSVGTILTGALAGPIAGLATGALTDLIWAYVLPAPLAAPTAGPFAITAAVIGLLAGLWAWLGFFRSRRAPEPHVLAGAVAAAAAVVLIVLYTFSRAYTNPTAVNLPEIVFVVIVAAFVVLAAWALFIRRDAGAVTALAAGLMTGLVAAVISAPIAAYVFGGVTGFGGDALIAAFRAAGASLYQATLAQGLLSDPLDKMVECLIVFLALAALPRRMVVRFPNGERLVERAA
jgi:hypothetical protein